MIEFLSSVELAGFEHRRAPGSEAREGTVMFTSPSTSLIVRGIRPLAGRGHRLTWPPVTVLALVLSFAITRSSPSA
jgi:hypothetical protein